MISDSFSSLFETQTESLIRKKIQALKKEAAVALRGLTRPQVINLIMVIEESLENFKSSLPEEARGSAMSSLEMLRGYCHRISDLIDSDIDELELPEEVNELQLFGAFAVSRYSYALEYLAGRRIPEDVIDQFGGERGASLALAADSTFDASLALLAGYSEFKHAGNHLTNVEQTLDKQKKYKIRGSRGGQAKSQKNEPLRQKAIELYENMMADKYAVTSEFSAAKDIANDLEDFALEMSLSPPSERTICRWLKKANTKEEWADIIARNEAIDAEDEN